MGNPDLRRLPSVSRLLEMAGTATLLSEYGHARVVDALRSTVQAIRQTITEGARTVPGEEEIRRLREDAISYVEPLLQWLRRPGTAFEDLATRDPSGTLAALRPDEARALTHQVRYEAYLDREQQEVERFRRFESLPLPEDLDYGDFPSLSLEVRDRLRQHRPATLGEAARLEGITPAALQALLARVRPRERGPWPAPGTGFADHPA